MVCIKIDATGFDMTKNNIGTVCDHKPDSSQTEGFVHVSSILNLGVSFHTTLYCIIFIIFKICTY